MKKIFITGGAGYVGARLVSDFLKKGYELTVYDIMYFGDYFQPKDNPNLKIIKGDIRDQKRAKRKFKNHDYFVHLACISNDTSFPLMKNYQPLLIWMLSNQWLKLLKKTV